MPHRRQPPSAAPHAYDARTQRVALASDALGITKHFYAYVPPDLAPGERAPCVYFLRGHEREWINGAEDASRHGRNVIDVYLDLRAAGRVGPLVLVFPGLTSDDNAIPSALVNMRAPELASGASGLGSGRFADYFYDDLIGYVDTHYPTIAGGRRRGLIGFSLGGAMAIKAAAERPDLFASAGAYDGTFLYAIDRGRRVRRGDGVIYNPMFDAAYDVPRNTRFIAHNSASNLIVRGDAAALGRITWIVGYGPERYEPWHSNFYRGEHLVRCLESRGLTNALPHAAFPDGDHTWRTADAFVELTLPLHDQALKNV